MLRQIANSAYTVASCLNRMIDRFAVGCVDDSEEGGLKILLPLASHSLHVAKRTMDDLRYLQLREAKPEGYGLDKAILEASDMLLRYANKDALSHIFLITANSQTPFPLPNIDKRVGFHTISPDPQLRLSNLRSPVGWHIFPDIDTSNTGTVEVALMGKVSKVLQHLRTGTNPGIVTDLAVRFTPGQGCRIESVLDETYCPMLRPGEKWTISVQVRVPAASVEQMFGSGVPADGMRMDYPRSSQTIDQLMIQLHEMLEYVPGESDPQTIMTASLLYKHSLLPESSTVEVSRCCEVVRALRRDSGCIIGVSEEAEGPVGNLVDLSPPEAVPNKGQWAEFEDPETPFRPSLDKQMYERGTKGADGSKSSFTRSSRYSWTTSTSGSWGTQKSEIKLQVGLRRILSNTTNLLRNNQYDRRNSAAFVDSTTSRHDRSVRTRKARVSQSYENIRQRFKIFGDRERFRGTLQDDFVVEHREPSDGTPYAWNGV